MFINDLLDLLHKYKASYPHRQIEVRGELQLDVDSTKEPAATFKEVIKPTDETKGN